MERSARSVELTLPGLVRKRSPKSVGSWMPRVSPANLESG
jgi:hypothetical protein